MLLRGGRLWLLGAALLYLVSLWLPALEGPGFPARTGLDVLRQGAQAWHDYVVAWYANPVLWLCLALGWAGVRRAAQVTAVLGLVLALSSFSAGYAAELAGGACLSSASPSGFMSGSAPSSWCSRACSGIDR
jgi:hypothetical protein